jgi:hypothetical protein
MKALDQNEIITYFICRTNISTNSRYKKNTVKYSIEEIFSFDTATFNEIVIGISLINCGHKYKSSEFTKFLNMMKKFKPDYHSNLFDTLTNYDSKKPQIVTGKSNLCKIISTNISPTKEEIIEYLNSQPTGNYYLKVTDAEFNEIMEHFDSYFN